MNTREKILMEALSLFSNRGYDSVSVRDIAQAVGIKESSLYNHFRNKQDIFDTILNEYSGRMESFFHSMKLTGDDRQFMVDDRTVNMYRQMTNQQFAFIAGQIFDFYFTDELNVKFRRLLTIEQYRNEHIGKLFRDLSFDSAIQFQSSLFAALMEAGAFKKCDPEMLALAFFSPIFLIFYKFDNDEKSLQEAKTLFMRHIDHFDKTYGSLNEAK